MASDPEGGPLQYRISGGNDAAWFSFGPDAWMTSTDDPQPLLYFHSTIVGSFPDFEHPADSDKDNVYEVTITASDGLNEAAQAIRLTITNDSSKGPVFTHSSGFPYFELAAVMENTTAVTTITATPDHAGDPVTYSLGGDARFSIDPTTGALELQRRTGLRGHFPRQFPGRRGHRHRRRPLDHRDGIRRRHGRQ